jgi:signal transduction histidine kinase
LIEDLLDVTHLEAGHLSMNRARVAAAQMVSEAIDGQKPLAAAAGVHLSSELERDLPELWVDRDRLLQVFENLIGNALKFTEPGGHVKVGAARRGADVSFWVVDTGSGIASHDLPHVFNRFWQAQKKEHGGVGLGLPIVKGIIEAHGGRVWVESTLGQGSTFFFTIPAIQSAAPTPDDEP